MPLVRLLLLCLAIVAVAAMPSRAATICPMQTLQVRSDIDCDHATAAHDYHKSCPGSMACCAPIAVRAAVMALVSPHAWRVLHRERPEAERDREDASLGNLRRPPRSA